MKHKNVRRLLQMVTFFGRPRHSRVVFCIDVSQRMQELKRVVLQQVIAHLWQMRDMFAVSRFNVILFADTPIKFSPDMQDINPGTLDALKNWIKAVESLGPMSFLLPALMSAIHNTKFCCIYLVSDGLVTDCDSVLHSHIRKISTNFNVFAFLITKKLPPSQQSLRLFQIPRKCNECKEPEEDPWSAITLVTTRNQAEQIRLTALCWDTSDSTPTEDDFFHLDESMSNWLDSQLLISNSRDSGMLRNSPATCPSRKESSVQQGIYTSPRRRDRNLSGHSRNRKCSAARERKESHKPLPSDNDYDSPKRRDRDSSDDRRSVISSPRKQKKNFSPKRPYHDNSDQESYQNRNNTKIFVPESVHSGDDVPASAGGLMLGRHVLVPNRNADNALYLAVVKAQKQGKRFTVVFCLPKLEMQQGDSLDYYSQDVQLFEMLSYTDLYRHAICEEDTVLVPSIFLNLRERKKMDSNQLLDPPFAGQAYVLAKVIEGYESRKNDHIGCTESSSVITVQVEARAPGRPRTVEIPAGCAVWLPNKKASVLYASGDHFFSGQKNKRETTSPFREEKDVLCMHELYSPVQSPHRSKTRRDSALLVTTNTTTEEEEDVNSMSESPPPFAKGNKSKKLRPLHKRVDSADSALSARSSASSCFPRHRNDGNRDRGRSKDRRNNHMTGSSPMLNKRIHSSVAQSMNSDANEKPKWKYWGRDPIPCLLDPISHEPYIPMQVFGSTVIDNAPGGTEWPSAHFITVNHIPENKVAQLDSSRIYDSMRQIPPPKSADILVTRSQSYANDIYNGDDLEAVPGFTESFDEGLPNVLMRDLYRRRLKKNLRDTKLKNKNISLAKSIQSQ